MRISENQLSGNFLAHAQKALQQMAQAQERIASGRRILRPSDDPAGLVRALALRADLRRTDAYRENASAATAFMSLTESSLQELGDHLSHAKELLVQGINAPTEGEGADSIALELRSMVDAVLIVANREVGDRSLFGGQSTIGRPWSRVNDQVVYRGDRGDLTEELGPGLRVAVNLSGEKVFQVVPSRLENGVDLDPIASRITSLADVNGGAGASTGHIRITDSNGVAADVDLLSATNLGEVIDGINNAGTAVTAALSADGKSIVLTDTAGGASFSVEDMLGGELAEALGIAGTSTTGTLQGSDLDPAATENTPVAHLLGGSGVAPDAWLLQVEVDGKVLRASVDPSGANTLGDLLRLIEGAKDPGGEPLDLTARIENGSLVVEARRTGAELTIQDSVSGGAGARALGLAGRAEPRTVFQLFEDVAEAVETRDTARMDGLLKSLQEAVDRTAGVRASYGARSRQAILISQNLEDRSVDLTVRLADVEDADLAREATDLTRAETVYNASLSTGNRLLGRSLFDYLG